MFWFDLVFLSTLSWEGVCEKDEKIAAARYLIVTSEKVCDVIREDR